MRAPPDDLTTRLRQAERFLEGVGPAAHRRFESTPPPRPAAPERAPRPAVTSAPEPDQPVVRVAPDAARAWLTTVPRGVTVERLRDALTAAGVHHGALEDALVDAAERAARAPVTVPLLVAEATPARPPALPIAELAPPPHLPQPLTLEAAEARVAALGEGKPTARRAWLVRPGDVVARVVRDPGEAGVDVGGAVTLMPEALGPPPPPPPPGAGVELDAAAGVYRATILGYAGLRAGRPTVASPLVVDEDGAWARLVVLPLGRGPHAPEPADLRALLSAAGVIAGVSAAALGEAATFLANGHARRVVEVARAEPAAPPVQPPPQFGFEATPRVGTLRADGSLDFKDLALFPNLRAGERVALLEPAEPGRPGRTVRGAILEPPPGAGVELVAGRGVRREDGAPSGRVELFAECAGVARVTRRTRRRGGRMVERVEIAVEPLVRVPGNVDFATGHLDVLGTVWIGGDVRAGFRVRATGDVVIEGGVERGASVRADGSVRVARGVAGPAARLEAGGDLVVGFAQGARLRAGQDLIVARYLHDADAQAGRAVQVGRGARGRGVGVVGGRVGAGARVQLAAVGSPWAADTVIEAGADAALVEALGAAEAEAREAERLLTEVLVGLRLPSLDPGVVAARLRDDPDRRALVERGLRVARDLAARREANRAVARRARADLSALAEDAVIEVAGPARGGVTVRVGAHRVRLREDLAGVGFRLGRDREGAQGVVFVALDD
ncbi:MAG: DUF342 domain-containing protein [Myxococcales bacterium]|nr:DUF342 domain-containing protein [Myxococcales bacterium]